MNGLSAKERVELDNLRAENARLQSLVDYNIMMGFVDDPEEEDEDD